MPAVYYYPSVVYLEFSHETGLMVEFWWGVEVISLDFHFRLPGEGLPAHHDLKIPAST